MFTTCLPGHALPTSISTRLLELVSVVSLFDFRICEGEDFRWCGVVFESGIRPRLEFPLLAGFVYLFGR